MVSDSRFHRRSDAQALVNKAEIVEHLVDRDGVLATSISLSTRFDNLPITIIDATSTNCYSQVHEVSHLRLADLDWHFFGEG